MKNKPENCDYARRTIRFGLTFCKGNKKDGLPVSEKMPEAPWLAMKRPGSFYSRCAQAESKEMKAESPTWKIFLFTGQLSVIFTSVSPTRTW